MPEALQLGTMFDRWTEVGNFHKLKGVLLSSCLRGRFKEKINYYQNTRDLSLTLAILTFINMLYKGVLEPQHSEPWCPTWPLSLIFMLEDHSSVVPVEIFMPHGKT